MRHTPRWVAIDFDTATVRPGPDPGSFILTVAGMLRRTGEASLGVRLAADRKYLVRPEYWEIEVQFDEADAILMSEAPYRTELPLDGIRGSKGIEVVGKSRLVKIDVP